MHDFCMRHKSHSVYHQRLTLPSPPPSPDSRTLVIDVGANVGDLSWLFMALFTTAECRRFDAAHPLPT
jgi:hypothetical protein